MQYCINVIQAQAKLLLANLRVPERRPVLVGLRMYVIDGVYKKIRDDWCSPIPSCGEEGHQRCAVCDAMVKNFDGINGAKLHLAPDNTH